MRFLVNMKLSELKVESIDRFVDLQRDNEKLVMEVANLRAALRRCGIKVYEFTGRIEDADPERWLNEKIELRVKKGEGNEGI